MKARLGVVVVGVCLCAVLALADSGTVTSANRVGYVKVAVGANAQVMSGLNFEGDNPTVNEIFKDQLTGGFNKLGADNVIMWDALAQEYVTYWKSVIDSQWYKEDEGSPTTDSIVSGQGFWLCTKRLSQGRS